MVSLQAPLMNSKKRKWEEEEEIVAKAPKLAINDNIELNLDTPLPAEWQRCLDIKSGEIHYYNTRTHTRTSTDPRQQCADNLDLELNLACEPRKSDTNQTTKTTKQSSHDDVVQTTAKSWLSSEEDEKEMVAAVCMRCHMLVMMCKATPSCPNCKFVHPPPEQAAAPPLFKSGFKLLCCKD